MNGGISSQNIPTKDKIVVIGDKNVGKSSCIDSFLDKEFDEYCNADLEVCYKEKQMNLDGQ